MTKKVAISTIVVQRLGETINVMPGQTFDFNDAELEDIERMSPDSIRNPHNEDESALQSSSKGGKKSPAEQETL